MSNFFIYKNEDGIKTKVNIDSIRSVYARGDCYPNCGFFHDGKEAQAKCVHSKKEKQLVVGLSVTDLSNNFLCLDESDADRFDEWFAKQSNASGSGVSFICKHCGAPND